MNVGSLVECVARFYGAGIKFPQVGQIYTVRSIERIDKGVYIRLEEIVNPQVQWMDNFGEARFSITGFREILPMDISELIEELGAVEV